MKSLLEEFLSRDKVQKVVTDVTGKTIMLMIGLVIGYYLKNWLL